MSLAVFAPAKVNLFLHVGPAGPDGFHPICSLMAFADFGDELSAEPAEDLELVLDGPFAADVPAGEDNLVLRALSAAARHAGTTGGGLRLILSKQTPAQAGLGGGSADAAATLKLIDRWLGLGLSRTVLLDLAANLGSDVAACLESRPVLALGRGERLAPAPALPELPAVLVRPDAACATAEVYRAFDGAGQGVAADRPPLPAAIGSVSEAARLLGGCRNDLEAPAIGLCAPVGEALAALRAAPEALLARMSGSGSACFALCADTASAARLADRLGRARPDWWVRACRLGGPWRA